ncbi:S-phase kinase-associated protein 1A [Xylaria sp. FL1042]|nr:S-phase kinase-associated protein 1A [Xylaria sp. FL1042]
MPTNLTTMVTMIGNDGLEVRTSLAALKQSITLKTMLEDLEEDKTTDLPIPVPGVDGKTLKKIVEWCEYHRNDPVSEFQGQPDSEIDLNKLRKSPIPEWDAKFLAVDRELIFKLANAANYLEITLLLKYTILAISKKLESMSTEQMRKYLNISNDYSKEEEAALRATHAWAFDGQ